jgi:hypothetical protein
MYLSPEKENTKQLRELRTNIKEQTLAGPHLLNIKETNIEAKDNPK